MNPPAHEFHLRLVRLTVHVQEDATGGDTPKVEVHLEGAPGSVLPGNLFTFQLAASKKTFPVVLEFPANSFAFFDLAVVKVFEEDDLDPNDLIGTVEVRPKDVKTESSEANPQIEKSSLIYKQYADIGAWKVLIGNANYEIEYQLWRTENASKVLSPIQKAIEAFSVEAAGATKWNSSISAERIIAALEARLGGDPLGEFHRWPTQAYMGWCGPASILYLLQKHWPMKYIGLVREIWMLGCVLGKPIEPEIRQAKRATLKEAQICLNKLKEKEKKTAGTLIDDVDDIDWIGMAGLLGTQQTGIATQPFGGALDGASVWEVENWVQDVLGFADVNVTNAAWYSVLWFAGPWGELQKVESAGATASHGGVAILRVDSDMIDELAVAAKKAGYAVPEDATLKDLETQAGEERWLDSHIFPLIGPVRHIGKTPECPEGAVQFSIFTWGHEWYNIACSTDTVSWDLLNLVVADT